MNLPGGPHSPMNMQQMVRQNTMQGKDPRTGRPWEGI